MRKLSEKQKLYYIATAGLIAAVYVVLIFVFQPFSFGAVQVRVAEALTILPFFTSAAIPGVTIGCLLGNLLTGASILDIVFGTLATFIGAIGSYYLRKWKFLVPLPPIIANTIVVPWVLRYAYGLGDAIPFLMLTVGIGEIISCGLLGMLLLFALNNYRNMLFGNLYRGAK